MKKERFKLTLEDAERSYKIVKEKAFNFYNSKNIDELINYIDISATIASNFNWIFTDEEVENLLKKIADEFIIKEKRQYLINSKRIVFYDQIGTTACLGLQYLRGLIADDYEILYIFESSTRKCSPLVINELKEYSKAKYLIIDSNMSGKIDNINDLYKTIILFGPQKAILHSPAEGAFGVILWNAFSQIERYRIVPGDHHFYLGVCCSDYFLEFRKYGFTVAIEKRKIRKEQILIQPYYPIIDNNEFFGFPIEIQNKVIIFSAGWMYKTYGEGDLYFNIIKKLLLDFPEVVILFAGSGFDIPFRKFIKCNNFEDRLILLGYRNDLNMCIANSDIYLATFPFTGGLMSQYAAYYSKPILSYTNKSLSSNFLEDIIGSPFVENQRVTYTSLDELFIYAEKIIRDKAFRYVEGNRLNEMLTTKKQFDLNLHNNLNSNILSSFDNLLAIDYDKHKHFYLNLENSYIPTIKSFLFNKFKLRFFFLFPWLVIPTFCNSLFLKKIIRSLR